MNLTAQCVFLLRGFSSVCRHGLRRRHLGKTISFFSSRPKSRVVACADLTLCEDASLMKTLGRAKLGMREPWRWRMP